MAYKDPEKQKKSSHESYLRNKERIAERQRKNRQWFKDYKNTLSCMDCGFSHPAAIEFHHRDPSHKSFEISATAWNGHSKEKVMAEIEKCDVLCSNCHRIRHWNNKPL